MTTLTLRPTTSATPSSTTADLFGALPPPPPPSRVEDSADECLYPVERSKALDKHRIAENASKPVTAMGDAELLATVLGWSTRKEDAVRAQLVECGGLRKFLEADHQPQGITAKQRQQFQAVLEISRRYLEETVVRGDPMDSVAATRRYLTARMRHQPHEVFACMFLDNRHRLIAYEELFHGTIDGASVHPRQVVKRALHHNAAAVVFAHNHPSGQPEPSRADEQITRRLKDSLALIDVRVLDHFVVGEKVTSFAERGLL